LKFLTIAKMKDSTLMLPPSVLVSIFEASLSAWEQQRKAGKLLDFYYSPASGHIIGFLNYDNADQWMKDQIMLPILMYYDYQTYALANYDEYIKTSMEAAKAAAKMMADKPK
jgi:hypothetical protein